MPFFTPGYRILAKCERGYFWTPNAGEKKIRGLIASRQREREKMRERNRRDLRWLLFHAFNICLSNSLFCAQSKVITYQYSTLSVLYILPLPKHLKKVMIRLCEFCSTERCCCCCCLGRGAASPLKGRAPPTAGHGEPPMPSPRLSHTLIYFTARIRGSQLDL